VAINNLLGNIAPPVDEILLVVVVVVVVGGIESNKCT
jgi:hypothetical protein